MILALKAETYAVAARCCAMQTANQAREQAGQAQAYPEETFFVAERDLYAISGSIQKLVQEL